MEGKVLEKLDLPIGITLSQNLAHTKHLPIHQIPTKNHPKRVHPIKIHPIHLVLRNNPPTVLTMEGKYTEN